MMKMISILSLVLTTVAGSLFAQEQKPLDDVKVLEHPRYSLLDRLTLDLTFTSLPLDAFYKPFLVEVGASYQFHELFSWDVIRFGYSLGNLNTGLKKSIENEANRELEEKGISQDISLEDGALKKMRYRISSHGFVNILYSKSNLFNRAIVYHQWQLGTGLSYYDMDKKSQIAIDLEARVRFFVNDQWLVHVHGGHSIGFKSGAPKNIMTLGAGVGFAF